jgi:hypothetical protein
MRLKQRSSVLLPQPEGPMNATTLRSGTLMLTDRTAGTVPYSTDSVAGLAARLWVSNQLPNIMRYAGHLF